MNYKEMLIELNNGKIISRKSWSNVKRCIRADPLDNNIVHIGVNGVFIDATKDIRNNFIGGTIKKEPINISNTTLIESLNDDVDDWVIFNA